MSGVGLRSRSGRTALIGTAAVILAVIAVAWVLQAMAEDRDGPPRGGPSPSYSLTVRQGGEVVRRYDLATLRALPQTTVVIDGKEQEGPLLRTVLDDAGVDPSASVAVLGAGLRDEGRLTLTPGQVDRGVQLDFSDRGTAKVCAAWLDRSAWVRDVISIDAR